MAEESPQQLATFVQDSINAAEEAEAKASAKARRASRNKPVIETLEQAEARVMATKLSDDEKHAVRAVFERFRTGQLTPPAKISKSNVLEMYRTIRDEEQATMRQRRIAETLRTKPSNYHIIADDRLLGGMVDRIRQEIVLQQSDPWFGRVFNLFDNTMIRRKLMERGITIPAVKSFMTVDTETSGLDKRQDMTGGYSIWLPLLNEGYYVAYGHLSGETQCTRSKALEAIRWYIEDAAHIKSFHNAEFDLSMFLNDDMDAKGFRYDSKDAQFILNDQEETYSLKPLVTKYKKFMGVDFDDYTFEDLFGNQSPMPHQIEVVGIYAVKDVHKGWALTKFQIDMMATIDNLYVPYFEIRQYLPEVNVNIERTGFRIDLDELKRLGDELRPLWERAKQAIYETYQINDQFLYDMSMAIKGEKITQWVEQQKIRIQRQADMLAKCRAEIQTAKPTSVKYQTLTERIQRYETNPLADAIPQNAPDYIHEFNLGSDDHVAYLVYDHLGIRDRTSELSKDKHKRRSVEVKVLEAYFAEEASLKPLADYSKYDKLLGTYIDKIPEALDVDGRLHTQFRTVSTGRYGSSGYSGKPNGLRPDVVTDHNYLDVMRRLVECQDTVSKGTNIQNIPSRNEEGLRVRKTFKPTVGHTFLGSDLQAIEPRLQAHRMAAEFGDQIFADMFRNQLDPYVEFASILFDVTKEACLEATYKSLKGTPQAVPPYRKIMKQLFLAEGYGQAFEQFYKSVQPYGITEPQARRAYAKFDEVLPGFKRMVESTFEQLRSKGWVATLWHQKRRFPEYPAQWRRLCALMRKAGITDKNDPKLSEKSRRLPWEERSEFWSLIRETGRAERQAFNHTIQGSGANVLQLCMIRSYYECVLGRGWEFNLTLHDEQKHSVPNDQLTQEAVDLYTDIMTNTVSLEVPLSADTVIEPEWMSEYGPDKWDFEKCCPQSDVKQTVVIDDDQEDANESTI